MNDTSTTDNTEQQEQQMSVSEGAASQEQSTETNPLKKYQDLVNSPTTPDGHKVVAAVAAASTVTVAAVANWLMKRKK
jgi:UDP-N-acetylmuramoylalanine-D-glutamate ligase